MKLQKAIKNIVNDFNTNNEFKIAETKLLLKKNKNLINGITFDTGKEFIMANWGKMITELQSIIEIEVD